MTAVTRRAVKKANFKFKPYHVNTVGILNNSYALKQTEARTGDMVFFKKGGATAYHVGIVTAVTKSKIYFFHASSSKGSIVISNMSRSWKSYWSKRFHSYRRWKTKVFVQT